MKVYECKTNVFEFYRTERVIFRFLRKFLNVSWLNQSVVRCSFEGNVMESDGPLGIDRYQRLERVE